MTPEQISSAASQLHQAELTGRQCGLMSLAYPGMSLVDAYAIQAAFVALKRKAGARIIGWKVGLTSRTMQRWHDVKTPTSGILLDYMLMKSGVTVAERRFLEPRVEAEITFAIKSDLKGSNVTRADVIAATDYVQPSLEVIDTRMVLVDPETGKRRKLVDSVSDNGSCAGIVLGEQMHNIHSVDLRWVGAILRRDGFVEETGLGAGVLDDPVASVVWLVRSLSAYGEGLKAGNLVLSGAFLRAIDVPQGSKFEVDFGEFGQVDLKFS